MSWVSTKERFQERRASHSNGVISETRIYLVRFDAIPGGAAEAINATSVPAYGATITVGSTTLYAKRKEAVAIDGSALDYLVNVTYESLSGGGSGEEIADPLSRPARISVSADEASVPYVWDADGKFVATSANELLQRQPERDTAKCVLNIVRNQASTGGSAFSLLTAGVFNNTLNSASITIVGLTFAARKLRMKPILAEYIIEGSYKFWQVTYPIIIPFDDYVTAWNHEVADQGYIANYGGIIVDILDPRKQRWPSPYPLDGSGGAKTNFTDAPAVLTFHPYAEADWSTLGLPSSLP